MLKLYAKTILASLAILFAILFAFYIIFSDLITTMSNRANHLFSKGNFSAIQLLLSNAPKSKWTDVLQKLQLNSSSASIVQTKELLLSEAEKEKLDSGEIVFINNKNLIFLSYGLHGVSAYQKIANSESVLKLNSGATMRDIIISATQLMQSVILSQLKTTPKNQWKETLATLQLQYGIPLKLLPENSTLIPSGIKKQLREITLSYAPPPHQDPIRTLYIKFPELNSFLVVGPIKYPYFSLQLWNVQVYFVFTLSLAVILSVLILTWLFNRNTQKIYTITKQYSQGNFTHDIQLNQLSTLQGVHKNITMMGDNIKSLIQSQQNMARFVAHEVRTPLYTIQLALDSLKKIGGTSAQFQEHSESIQEDILELNSLIASFLLYSQSTTHELTVNKKNLCLKSWLENIISKHQCYDIDICFHCQENESHLILFDPQLMKHAINNLLSNALKFANKQIEVSLKFSNAMAIIQIDDDGSGIPDSKRDDIFLAFSTLQPDDASNKHVGLGLSITKAIIELHQGSIVVNDSATLAGASFSVQMKI